MKTTNNLNSLILNRKKYCRYKSITPEVLEVNFNQPFDFILPSIHTQLKHLTKLRKHEEFTRTILYLEKYYNVNILLTKGIEHNVITIQTPTSIIEKPTTDIKINAILNDKPEQLYLQNIKLLCKLNGEKTSSSEYTISINNHIGISYSEIDDYSLIDIGFRKY